MLFKCKAKLSELYFLMIRNWFVFFNIFNIKSKDYRYFVFFILLVVFLFFTLIFVKCIKFSDNYVKNTLHSHAKTFDRYFSDVSVYSRNIMGFIAKRIKENNYDLKQTHKIIGSYNYLDNTDYPWSAFSWADKNGIIQVNSLEGVVKNGKDLSGRDYIKNAKVSPNNVILGKPVIGLTSNLLVIPIGWGVVDKNLSYKGVLVSGIVIDAISKKINNLIQDPYINFAIISNSDFSLLFDKKTGNNDDIYNYIKILKSDGLKEKETRNVFQAYFDLSNDYIFDYNFKDIPYKIILSYDKNKMFEKILKDYFDILFEFIILFVILFILVILIYRRFLSPLFNLLNSINKINDGETLLIPKNISYELSQLYNKINGLANFIKDKNEQSNNIIASVSNDVKRKSYELLLANEQNSLARKFSENIDNNKRIFFSLINHELRTPLNAIIGFSELILSGTYGDVNDEILSAVKTINDSGKLQLSLVDKMLEVSQLNARNFELKEEWFDIKGLIYSCLYLYQDELLKKNIKLNSTINQKQILLFADKSKIEQVFVNIISNAINYNIEDGQINIILYYVKGSNLEITIEDTGIGIEKARLANILYEFSNSIDVSKRSENQGVGLGLPIVRLLIEAHNCDIKIESVLNKGTSIKLIFPDCRVSLSVNNGIDL